MMSLGIILAASVILQFSASIYALFMIKYTGVRYSWLFISAALFFMCIRRIIPLYYVLTNIHHEDITVEIIGLVLSVFMLAGVHGIRSIFDEMKQKELRIKYLLEEKEIFLKEVHHRIKNNMNTVKCLLSLQAASLSESRAVESLKDAEGRVHSMMMLYDKLYRSDNISEMSVDEYIPSLVDQIFSNFPNNEFVTIEKNIDSFILDVKKLQLIGIIINELMTNAMKYAFTGKKNGKIQVSVLSKNECFSVIIADDGKGIPGAVNIDNCEGFGLMLVKSLVEQLHGKMSVISENGTRICMEFMK